MTPQNAHAFRLKIDILNENSISQEDQRKCEETLEIDPDNVDILVKYAKILSTEWCGKYAEAQVQFEKALSLQPENVNARIDYALFLHHIAKYNKAQVQCEEILKIAPQDTDILMIHWTSCTDLADITRPERNMRKP